MKMDKILCRCMRVTIGQVAEAVDQGATTFDEVQAKTNVARGCKRCKDDVVRVIEELVQEKSN